MSVENITADDLDQIIRDMDGWWPETRDRILVLIRDHDAKVRAEAIREYVAAARENPHTYYWPPSGVLDDAEQWADEIEKGTI